MAFQGERGKRRRRRQTELQNGNKYCTILITHILRQRLAVFSELKGKSSGRCRVSCGGGGYVSDVRRGLFTPPVGRLVNCCHCWRCGLYFHPRWVTCWPIFTFHSPLFTAPKNVATMRSSRLWWCEWWRWWGISAVNRPQTDLMIQPTRPEKVSEQFAVRLYYSCPFYGPWIVAGPLAGHKGTAINEQLIVAIKNWWYHYLILKWKWKGIYTQIDKIAAGIFLGNKTDLNAIQALGIYRHTKV